MASGFTALPRMEGALSDLQQKMIFTVVVKTDVDYKVVETKTDYTFKGVWYPLRGQELMLKPEGQRGWRWFSCIAEPKLSLDLDSEIEYGGITYRVKNKSDFKEYGFIEYHLIEDYTGGS